MTFCRSVASVPCTAESLRSRWRSVFRTALSGCAGGSSVFRWVGGRWLFGFNTIAPWGRLCENPSPYALRSGTWGVRATVLGVSGCETAPPKLVVWTWVPGVECGLLLLCSGCSFGAALLGDSLLCAAFDAVVSVPPFPSVFLYAA